METRSPASSLARVVTVLIVVAAIGSLVPMFILGHRQRSVLLMAMFFVWVTSPYVGLWLLNARARVWNPSRRRTLQYATVLISLLALARYAWVVVWPLKSQPASTFMIVPFVSWIAIAVAAAETKRRSHSGQDTHIHQGDAQTRVPRLDVEGPREHVVIHQRDEGARRPR